MIPILFEHNATTFNNHGLGDLVDAIECVVKQVDTNEFELEMKYPITGRLYNELTVNRIIYAKVNNGNHTMFTIIPHTISYQAFRIYGFEREIAGYITVKAQHISYDLNDVYVMNSATTPSNYYGTPAPQFVSTTPEDIITFIQNKRISGTNNFTLSTAGDYTNPSSKEAVTSDGPRSARSLLFDSSNSLLANYGGTCSFDNFKLKFYESLNTDPVATIDYGDELIDLTQEQNISEMYTGFLPYCIAKDWVYFEDDTWHGVDSIVYGNVVYASGTFNRQRIIPVDLSEYFNVDRNNPTDNKWGNLDYITYGGNRIYVPAINDVAQRYAELNEFGVPDINITLDYSRGKNEIEIFDLIHIKFQKLGVAMTSRVVSVTYDVLNERNTEIEIGKSKSSTWRYSDNEYAGKKRW